LFEVSFKAKHDCPYVKFSMKHPNVKMVGWCNGKTDVIEVDCPDIETYTRIESDLQELISWGGGGFRLIKKTFGEKNVQVVVKNCACGKIPVSISDVVQRNSCLSIPPDVYFGGWEEHRVIGFRDTDYKKLFRELERLGPVEITQKKNIPEKTIRDAFIIPLSTVLSQLTGKQAEALMIALDLGYYNLPKKMTAEEFAVKNKVPRTTFEEHLRKAESKIMRAMAPYVRMYTAHSPGAPERPQQLFPLA